MDKLRGKMNARNVKKREVVGRDIDLLTAVLVRYSSGVLMGFVGFFNGFVGLDLDQP